MGTGVRPRPLWGQALNRTGTPGSGSLGLVGATHGPWGNVSLVPPLTPYARGAEGARSTAWLLPSSNGGDPTLTHLQAPHPRRATAVHGDSLHTANTSGVKRRFRRRRQETLPGSPGPFPGANCRGGCSGRAAPLR